MAGNSQKRKSPDGEQSQTKPTHHEANPEMIRYVDQISREAVSFNQKIRKLLSTVNTESLTGVAEDSGAWGSMIDGLNELALNCAALKAMHKTASQSASQVSATHPTSTTEEARAPTTTPTTPSNKPQRTYVTTPTSVTRKRFLGSEKSRDPELRTPNKKRRMAVASAITTKPPTSTTTTEQTTQAQTPQQNRKRRMDSDEDSATAIPPPTTAKKNKRAHREMSERPTALGKRGRTGEEDCTAESRTDTTGFKRPRGEYFQAGDPPLEYMTDSEEESDGEGDELKPAPPGSVRINVTGAFIVDEDNSSGDGSPTQTGANTPSRNGPETKDIRLPHHKPAVSHMAVDIGGSLAKLVYFTNDPNGIGGKLNFKSFETENIDELINYMLKLKNGEENKEKEDKEGKDGTKKEPLYVMATGGGAYKYFDKIQEKLGVKIYREDEMECLIVGLDFFITEIPFEVFTYTEADPMHFASARSDIYPYLLVNIGSGVSMIKVSGPQQFERIGGSSLGGGTLWGLLALLTGAKTFDDMLGMASRGDNTNVDMLVGDIYGGGYEKIGLKATTIASSFGKVFKKATAPEGGESAADGAEREGEVYEADEVDEVDGAANGAANGADTAGDVAEASTSTTAPLARFAAEDISRSLLYMVSNNIGQIAYLQAQNHGLKHIYFGGSFIRGHAQTMHTLSFGMRYWSKGTKKAYFLRHEGYLGAVGAFLRRQPRNWGRRNSAGESTAERWIPEEKKNAAQVVETVQPEHAAPPAPHKTEAAVGTVQPPTEGEKEKEESS